MVSLISCTKDQKVFMLQRGARGPESPHTAQVSRTKQLTFRLSTGPIFSIKLFSTNWCLKRNQHLVLFLCSHNTTTGLGGREQGISTAATSLLWSAPDIGPHTRSEGRQAQTPALARLLHCWQLGSPQSVLCQAPPFGGSQLSVRMRLRV